MSIDTSFQSAIAAGKIAGSIILACDSKGHEFQSLLGQRTLPNGSKVDHQLDDVLFLASASKLLTTIAALQCVEEGKISLDDELREVGLPTQVLVSYEDAPELVPAKPITLRHLLSHSAGMNYFWTTPAIAKWRGEHSHIAKNPNGKFTVEEYVDSPLAYQPGESWMYGPAIDWAGRIVEKITGQSLGDRIRTRVLKTNDAEFFPVQRLRNRMVDLNPLDPEGTGKAVAGGEINIHENNSGDFGGHGLFATAPAFLAVLRSILTNDSKILHPETVNVMFHDQLAGNAKINFQDLLNSPRGSGYRQGTTQTVGFGLGGLLTLEDSPGWYGAHTMTWSGGLTLVWFIDRQNDLCGICAIQASIPVDFETIEHLKQVFRKEVYSKKASWSDVSTQQVS